MNAANRVIERDANWLHAVGRDGEIVAAARRFTLPTREIRPMSGGSHHRMAHTDGSRSQRRDQP
jgi:hypothetical protein